ncbi:MAG TPA: GNAT family N-acetyltransferase [Kiloniellaceae bacterium]|nr:GNAT family N-acetyltransferase [Kiloniellaceae bacterium]
MSDLAMESGSGRYRQLGRGDAACLAELQAASFADTQPWDAKAMAELLAMPGAFGFVVYLGKQPRGYLLARLAASEAEIVSLAVHPVARRKGLAQALLRLLVRQVAAQGGDRVFLEVAETNVPARRLYDGFAFREVGRRPGYYRGKAGEAVAALIMAYTFESSGS